LKLNAILRATCYTHVAPPPPFRHNPGMIAFTVEFTVRKVACRRIAITSRRLRCLPGKSVSKMPTSCFVSSWTTLNLQDSSTKSIHQLLYVACTSFVRATRNNRYAFIRPPVHFRTLQKLVIFCQLQGGRHIYYNDVLWRKPELCSVTRRRWLYRERWDATGLGERRSSGTQLTLQFSICNIQQLVFPLRATKVFPRRYVGIYTRGGPKIREPFDFLSQLRNADKRL